MNENQLKRLVQLSRKTQDPLVILDADGSGSVLLSLDRYEELVQGSLKKENVENSYVIPPVKRSLEPQKPQATKPAQQIFQQTEEEINKPEMTSRNTSSLESGDIETQFYLEPVE